MPETILPPDIHAIVEAHEFVRLRHTLENWSPSGIAELMVDLPVDERALVFRLLPRKLAAEVFEYFPVEDQEQLVKAMAKEELAAILNEMAPEPRCSMNCRPRSRNRCWLCSVPRSGRSRYRSSATRREASAAL